MDGRLVAPRIPGLPMYGQPFNAPHFPAGYLPYGAGDPSAFYSPLAIGESAEAWRAGLSQAAAAVCYDPAIAAAHYGYGYGPIIGDGARRKNATRETTSTLKAWLSEHRKNPYPTKGEKIMLAIITKMSLTQVSTWFANARRRLKKENKMTWSPRNRCGEDDDDDVMDGDDESSNLNDSHRQSNADRNRSRSSSPTPTTKTPTDGSSRLSGFDLPHQTSLHPFLSRPAITGSFTIQRPSVAPSLSLQSQEDSAGRRSAHDDEEDVDLESLQEDQKESAFNIKRSKSTDLQSTDSFHRHGPSPSHPIFQASTTNSSLARGIASQTHTLQSSAFGPSRTSRRDSISPRSHPYSRNSTNSPAAIASLSITSSHSKPKIWSLADVATSNDSKQIKCENTTSTNVCMSKPSQHPAITAMLGSTPRPMQSLMAPHHQSPMNHDTHATFRNLMGNAMQQNMAAAVAAAAAAMSNGQNVPPTFFPGGLLPQHLAVNPAAIAMAASLPRGHEAARFPHPFPGFAELAAAQRAQMAATQHAADIRMLNGTNMHPACPSIVNAHKHDSDASGSRHRIKSSEDKRRSPASIASSPRSEMAEISVFTAVNNRPRSGDSGIASAETSKESLTLSTESSTTK